MPLPLAMLDGIAGIYDAALNPGLWPSVLRQLGGLLDSTAMSIVVEEADVRIYGASFGISPEAGRDWWAHYRHVDPVRIHMDRSPPGVYSSRQIVPKSNLYSREIFGDYGRLHGLAYCMQGYVFRENGRSAIVAACRPTEKDEFEPAEVALLTRLVPHLKRALHIQMATRSVEIRADMLTAAIDRWPVAVFAAGAGGRIACVNQAAESLLADADGFRVRDGRLCAGTAAQTARLYKLLKRAAGGEDVACEGGSMLVERASGRRPLSVEVVPYPAGDAGPFGTAARILVFVSDPEGGGNAGQQRLRTLYNLTRSEAALAERISTGTGVKAAARSLGIAPSTARTHLRRVFEKMGVGRQAELANLVKGSQLSGG